MVTKFLPFQVVILVISKSHIQRQQIVMAEKDLLLELAEIILQKVLQHLLLKGECVYLRLIVEL
jgi:hypothetical protein